MADLRYRIKSIRISETQAYKEATAEELKVLIAITDKGGFGSFKELCDLAGVSKSRLISSLAFWEEAGAIARIKDGGNIVIEEFAERIVDEELFEERAIDVAAEIRDKALADFISEYAILAGKEQLSAMEVSLLTSIANQYGLSAEYLATLCAYIHSKGGISIQKLRIKAKKLCEDGIDTVSELEAHISRIEKESNVSSEIRAIFGIYGRSFSKSEKSYIEKWTGEYGFGIGIISEAYDKAVLSTGSARFRYIDTILKDWYEHSCKTVSECNARYAERKADKDAQRQKKRSESGAKASVKPKKPASRYGDFDPEEALRKALARSFSQSDSEESEN